MNCFKGTLILVFMLGISLNGLSAQESWYVGRVKSGIEGMPVKQKLSIEKVMELSSPGDTIYVLPGELPLVGEIILKEGQSLIGISEDGQVPVISNPGDSLSGFGVILSNHNLVKNLTIDSTYKSALFGENSTGVELINLTITNSNLSGHTAEFQIPELPITLTHGGVVILNSEPGDYKLMFSNLKLDSSAGTNMTLTAANGAKVKIILESSSISGGEAIALPHADIGLGLFADGPGSEVRAEVFDSRISGRRSRSGRNLIAWASRKGVAKVEVNRSYIGVCGQDGVLGIASFLPAKVDISIVNSLIEKAGQLNVEGTLLNQPAYDPKPQDETEMNISILNSIVKDPGKEIKFSSPGQNIWMGGTKYQQVLDPGSKQPVAQGAYKLTLKNSKILNSQLPALELGSTQSKHAKETDLSNYRVLIENSKFVNNRSFFLAIRDASNITFQASNICWDHNPEFRTDLFRLKDGIGVIDEALREKLHLEKSGNCEE